MHKKKVWTADLAKNYIDEHLESAKKKYSISNLPTLVSFRDLCSEWDWAQRSDVYTHLIHSYPAKLLPYIPIVFLTSSLSSENEIVLDPFAGTGTVLLESMVHKFYPRNSYGVEINPLARLIAKVKTTPLNIEDLTTSTQKLNKKINGTKRSPIPEFLHRDFWFRKSAQQQLAVIRYSIDQLDASAPIKDFFWVCFSAIIRDMSRADPFIAPPVIFKASKFSGLRQKEMGELLRKKNRANAYVLFSNKIADNLERMKSFSVIAGLRNGKNSKIIWDDARNIRKGVYEELGSINKTNSKSLKNSVNLIITSPPYIAAQKYIRTTKLELAWLGIANDIQIQTLDRTLIGSEKYYSNEPKGMKEVNNPTADILLEKVSKKNPLRACIASRYYHDMRDAINSMYKILKPDGYCILIIGNNTVAGIPAKNHIILSEIAAEDGRFSTELVLRDNIRSHGMITKRHETSSIMQDEYILLLKKGAN